MRCLFAKKLAKGSKSNIPPVDDVISKKCFKGLPLKFYGESNGAIKIFGYQIFNVNFTGSRTGSDVIDVGNRLFKTFTGLTVSGHLSTNA